MKALPLAVCVAFLVGCDQIDWPHVWGPDEVPQAVRDEPRDVPTPPALPKDTPYPLVGSVPSMPKSFTPPSTIELTKEMMEDDRAQAKEIQKQTAEASASASDHSASFAAKAGVEYALAESGSEIYTLKETEGSPPISKIHLPKSSDDASSYAVSYLAGKDKWSPAQTYSAGALISLPNAMAIRVTLLNSTGTQIAEPGDFAFYLTFGQDGNANITMTGNEPPVGNTFVPVRLPQGGNPPISGASSVPPAKP